MVVRRLYGDNQDFSRSINGTTTRSAVNSDGAFSKVSGAKFYEILTCGGGGGGGILRGGGGGVGGVHISKWNYITHANEATVDVGAAGGKQNSGSTTTVNGLATN